MAPESSHSDEPTVPHMPEIGSEPTVSSMPTVKGAVPPTYSASYYSRQPYTPPPPPRQSMARERVRRRRVSPGRRGAEWVWVIAAGVLFSVVIFVTLSSFLWLRSTQQEIEFLPTADIRGQLPTPVVVHNNFADPLNSELGDALILPDGSSIALTPWDGSSRFTMIFVGLDRRAGERGLAYRTDSMMLISLDPQTQSIGVLSIPRDLYVQVPGYSSLQRVNTPMFFGETQRVGYGPTLMMQTVQLNLGIRVHDYVAVDFQAFIDIINAVGGVTITTDYIINDPRYPNLTYGYDPFYLPAGTHTLDGYNTLRFARTRHGDSDIRRAERQQQVLMAVRDKVLTLDMLPGLLMRAPELWQSLSDNLYTGLSFQQIIQLALYARDVPSENIKMGVIDYRYLRSYSTPEGASVLIPDRSRLGALMVELFGQNYSQ